MLRRSFLKRMAFAALATALPHIPLPTRKGYTATQAVEDLNRWTETFDPRLNVVQYQHVVYGLGFAVTKELLEDDVYGVAVDHYKQLITRFQMQPPTFATN